MKGVKISATTNLTFLEKSEPADLALSPWSSKVTGAMFAGSLFPKNVKFVFALSFTGLQRVSRARARKNGAMPVAMQRQRQQQ